jgi:peptidoglycan/LPS O-acetylase OafA/YrhL
MQRTQYLPGLDGLRALAVIAVLAFHANPAWLPAGFIGVEVFFVISGFIITRGLMAEIRTTGGLDLRRFWIRRARRLLPALVLLLSALLAYVLVFEPASVAAFRADLFASLAYVTNWHLVFSEQSYFDAWSRPSFLKHLWSLAIEEQFYLLWPPVLLLLATRLNRLLAGGLILLLAGASSLLMALLYEPGGDVSRLYYGTDTRIGALLLGSALGLIPPAAFAWSGRAALTLRGVAGVGALLVLAALAFALDEDSSFVYQGGFLVVSLTTAVAITSLAVPGSFLGRVLGVGPLRWVGVRSYGIYLWHWPIFLMGWPQLPTPAAALFETGLAVGAAALSYRLLEEPVRNGASGDRFRGSRTASSACSRGWRLPPWALP